MPSLDGNLPEIPALDKEATTAAEARQAILTKPTGALGRLEALSVRLAGMTGQVTPRFGPDRKALVICAGDHGVAAKGVSAYPQEVTVQMVANFLAGGAAANVLARQMNARVIVVDAGVAGDIPEQEGLVTGKVAPGTQDLSEGPAMTREQANAALQLGLEVAEQQLELGLDLLAVGEMGIGNTTAARALKVNQPLDISDGIAVLATLGGFEIGAMAGLMLGAAAARVPVVVDGFISTAAALLAKTIRPGAVDYMFAGHRSAEAGHDVALEALGLKPLLDLNLRLGEGTGALLAFSIIEAAARMLAEMATFEEAGVSDKE
jgi:nicotinate-nucleotide--dimethylbenzimidazole phosphoribosyltransferase